MEGPARKSWAVMLATMAVFWQWVEGVAHAANVGAWTPVSIWITGLTALAWGLCVVILVFGVVQFLMGLTAYREEGIAHGLIRGASVILGAVIAFFIIPPLVEAGIVLGATIR